MSQYGPDTWEWTINREFFDHFVSRAAHLLDLAITADKTEGSKLKSIAEAGAWLEAAKLNDDMTKNSPATWKNLGLAYMNLVRSRETKFPELENVFKHTANQFLIESVTDKIWWSTKNEDNMDWKSWSSMKWESSWGHYMKMDDAKKDPSFQQIKSIYETVLESVRR